MVGVHGSQDVLCVTARTDWEARRKPGRKGRTGRGVGEAAAGGALCNLPGPSKGPRLCVKECVEQGEGLWEEMGHRERQPSKPGRRRPRMRWQGASPHCCPGTARSSDSTHSSHGVRNGSRGLGQWVCSCEGTSPANTSACAISPMLAQGNLLSPRPEQGLYLCNPNQNCTGFAVGPHPKEEKSIL